MPGPSNRMCATCGEEILAGKGWIRDSQERPVHVRCPAPTPACAFCSKPVLPEAGVTEAGRRVHIRCLSREEQLRAMAERDRARQGIARSKQLILRTRRAMAQARAQTSRCVVCRRPLAKGSSLVFQGDSLVHTSCWRVPGAPGSEPSE